MNEITALDPNTLTLTDPGAAIAISIFSLVNITHVAVVILFIVGLAQIVVICGGMAWLSRTDKRRHAEHNKRHAEAMARFRRNGKALAALIRRTEGRRGALSNRSASPVPHPDSCRQRPPP